MHEAKSGKSDSSDPSLELTQALNRLDIKRLSYIQLRRAYAAAMEMVERLAGEIQFRKENDKDGDTVKVPAASKD